MSLAQFALGLGALIGDLAAPLLSAPSAPKKSHLDKAKNQIDKAVDRSAAKANADQTGAQRAVAGPVATDLAVSSAQLVRLAAEPAMAWDAGGWTCVSDTEVHVCLADGSELRRAYPEGTRILIESGLVLLPTA